MKQNFISISFTLCALLAVSLACSGGGSGGSSNEKPAGPEYVGAWRAADGSTITIRSDASADYKSGGTSVSGGSATVNEKDNTLSITFFAIGPTMKIDKAPADNQMTLDGIVYKKDGGGGTTSDNKSGGDAPGEVPPKDEVEQLLTKTLSDFTKGVEEGSLTDFHKNTSAPWREQYTQQETDDFFKVFFNKKEKVLPSLNNAIGKKPVITRGPTLDTEGDFKRLTVAGQFASKPYKVEFEAEYYWTEGRWGIKRFKADM